MLVKGALGGVSMAAIIARDLYRMSVVDYGRKDARQIVLKVLFSLGYGEKGINRTREVWNENNHTRDDHDDIHNPSEVIRNRQY